MENMQFQLPWRCPQIHAPIRAERLKQMSETAAEEPQLKRAGTLMEGIRVGGQIKAPRAGNLRGQVESSV